MRARDWRNQLVDDARVLRDVSGANQLTITITGRAAVDDFIRSLVFSAAMTDACDVRPTDFRVEGAKV